jgi:hypothetical protein
LYKIVDGGGFICDDPFAMADPIGVADSVIPLPSMKIRQDLAGHCFQHVTGPIRVKARFLSDYGQHRRNGFSSFVIECHVLSRQA